MCNRCDIGTLVWIICFTLVETRLSSVFMYMYIYMTICLTCAIPHNSEMVINKNKNLKTTKKGWNFFYFFTIR